MTVLKLVSQTMMEHLLKKLDRFKIFLHYKPKKMLGLTVSAIFLNPVKMTLTHAI